MSRTRAVGGLFLITAGLCGCASAPLLRYAPGSAASPPVTQSIAQARETFLRTLKSEKYVTQVRLVRDGTGAEVKAGAQAKDGSGEPEPRTYRCVFSFSDLAGAIEVQKDPRGHFEVDSPPPPAPCDPKFWSFWAFPEEADARAFAESLFVLSNASKEDLRRAEAAADAPFQEVVRQYRAQAVKPALPEEARRYKVQAEDCIKGKRYAEAIGLYAKALEAAPWWPEGYYNQALLLGDQPDYARAIAAMKRYLALEPSAPDARAAQDKIYAWEGRLERGE